MQKKTFTNWINSYLLKVSYLSFQCLCISLIDAKLNLFCYLHSLALKFACRFAYQLKTKRANSGIARGHESYLLRRREGEKGCLCPVYISALNILH